MLSGALVALGAQVTVCVATEYGCREQGVCSGVSVRTGRLEEAEMEKVLHGAALCVDATHPYAVRASGNIAAACARAGVPRLRLLRRESPLPADAAVFSTAQQAAVHLEQTEGNIFLTTGAKELAAFAGVDVQRLYVRVLPLRESLRGGGNVREPHCGHAGTLQSGAERGAAAPVFHSVSCYQRRRRGGGLCRKGCCGCGC